MSAAEFAFWAQFYRRHGFQSDRLEWAVALGASAVCASNRVRVEPKNLIPNFTRRRLSGPEIVAGLSGIPGVKIERRPRGGREGERHGG